VCADNDDDDDDINNADNTLLWMRRGYECSYQISIQSLSTYGGGMKEYLLLLCYIDNVGSM
jgi:hypothetical protein